MDTHLQCRYTGNDMSNNSAHNAAETEVPSCGALLSHVETLLRKTCASLLEGEVTGHCPNYYNHL
ncbi:hypothetical protein ACO0RG_002971 [Hanseniaspora osmophila]